MEEIEARKTQKLADFYSELLEIEEAFDSAKIEIETKFSIANNFDLENPETYVKLIRPVSRKIQHIGNTCKLATYKLKEYQQIAASTSNSSIKSPQIAASTSNSSTDSQNLTPTPTQTQYPLTLEPRLSRLEFLVYLLYCLLLAAVLGIVIPMLFMGLPNLLCKTYKDFLTQTRRSQNKSYTRLDFCRKTWLIIIYSI